MSDAIPRELLDSVDVEALRELLAADPARAAVELGPWCDHPLGAQPLNYVAMLRFDTRSGLWRDLAGTGAIAQALLDAGAPVDGHDSESETPLMTAASYGDAEVAEVLAGAGAELERRAAQDAGGIPQGTALRHAMVFGMTAVVDVLIAAGSKPQGIGDAAAVGDLSGWLTPSTSREDRVRALTIAAVHERSEVIDTLLDAGTPIDAVDPMWGGHPLRDAARQGKVEGVRTLLERGADTSLRDGRGRTALDLARHHKYADGSRHAAVVALLDTTD